jgi:hypothetical protein
VNVLKASLGISFEILTVYYDMFELLLSIILILGRFDSIIDIKFMRLSCPSQRAQRIPGVFSKQKYLTTNIFLSQPAQRIPRVLSKFLLELLQDQDVM